MRERQVLQFPDLFSFNNVRREIAADELPVLGTSIASTCISVATTIHEFTHDLDLAFKGSIMNAGFDRVAACGPELMDFAPSGSPFATGDSFNNPRDFVSSYAGGFNDAGRAYGSSENAAEAVTAYILFPQYFRSRATQSPYLLAQYNFIKQQMFGGAEFKNDALDHQSLAHIQPATMASLCFDVEEFRADEVKIK